MEIEYRVLQGTRVVQSGHGVAWNISSGGVFFETESRIAAGQTVELLIPWSSLAAHSALQLCAVGYAVRIEGNCCAVRILESDFGLSGQQPSLAAKN